MKQLLKLAELNMALTLAQRALIQAERADIESEEVINDLDYKVQAADCALSDHLNGKRLANELNKYEIRKDEVRSALIAAGYDTAVMDFF